MTTTPAGLKVPRPSACDLVHRGDRPGRLDRRRYPASQRRQAQAGAGRWQPGYRRIDDDSPGRAKVPQPSPRGLVHHGDIVVNKAVESVDGIVYQPVRSSSPFAPSRLRVNKVDDIVYQPAGSSSPFAPSRE